jgi:hypothetical protein
MPIGPTRPQGALRLKGVRGETPEAPCVSASRGPLTQVGLRQNLEGSDRTRREERARQFFITQVAQEFFDVFPEGGGSRPRTLAGRRNRVSKRILFVDDNPDAETANHA